MAQHNIPQRRMKAVDRWYAFEAPGVPRERTKWIKVRYPASSPALNITDCSKYKTFSHVFGATRSFLELLLLKRRLKGPSWISIQGAVAVPPESQITWASIEWSVDTPKAVTVIPDSQHPPPPLTILSLNMLTFLNEKQKVTIPPTWAVTSWMFGCRCRCRCTNEAKSNSVACSAQLMCDRNPFW